MKKKKYKIINNKKLAIAAVKSDQRNIHIVSKKLQIDPEVDSAYRGKLMKDIKKKIKFKDIEDKELAMIAVSTDGRQINQVSKKLQRDPDVIKRALKTGAVDLKNPKRKLKFKLPWESYWYLKYKNKKNVTNKVKKVKNFKLYEDMGYKAYYWGEILNGRPHGKGFSKKHDEDEEYLETYKGEWKNGKQEGKGELIEHDSHQDEGGKILNRYIGTFKNGKFVK